MGKSYGQKLKILYLMMIFMECTDETHGITVQDMISTLGTYGVSAERKSIYTDLEALRSFGLNIEGRQSNREYRYHLASRLFEPAELKLLADAIQSSRFITAKKSDELIKKLGRLAGRYEAGCLQKQVCAAGRIKTANENIYYNIDTIQAAINGNVCVGFQYCQCNVHKEMELKRDGKFYCISPWALIWNDGNYYMVGFDGEANRVKHYRVDRMLRTYMTKEQREGEDVFRHFDAAAYTNRKFKMFDGEEKRVRLECENRFAGVITDRFGGEASFVKKDEEHFTVNVKVSVSRQFLAWVFALGTGVKIIGPESVLEFMREEIARLAEIYKS